MSTSSSSTSLSSSPSSTDAATTTSGSIPKTELAATSAVEAIRKTRDAYHESLRELSDKDRDLVYDLIQRASQGEALQDLD